MCGAEVRLLHQCSLQLCCVGVFVCVCVCVCTTRVDCDVRIYFTLLFSDLIDSG